jgi:Uncharacterized protein conserved in bacteria (DUF2330)
MGRWKIVMAALAAVALAAPGTAALACGATVSADGTAELQGMSALLSYDGSREDLAVVVSYAAPTGPFVWLMPLPTTPQISATSVAGMVDGFQITTPPLESGYQPQTSFGSNTQIPQGGDLGSGRSRIGNLEFTTLGAADPKEVAAWMVANGFAYHDTQLQSVQGYLAKHWVIVAARTVAGSTPQKGAIAVRFVFPTTEPIYPLAIAGASHQGTLPMHLLAATPYRPASVTYSETTVQPASTGVEPSAQSRLELRYSSTLTEAERIQVGQSVAVPTGFWLTRYDAQWQLTDLSQDLVLNRAADQSEVNFDALHKRFQLEQDRTNRNNQTLQVAIEGTILITMVALVTVSIVFVIVLARGYRRKG